MGSSGSEGEVGGSQGIRLELLLLACTGTLSAALRAPPSRQLSHEEPHDAGCSSAPSRPHISPAPPPDRYPSRRPPLADILDAYQGYTIFIPLLNNVTAPQAAAFPQLSPNLVLPTVYATPADLLAAGEVTNLGNVTISLEDNPGAGALDATFVELGATAQIYPIAFPIGKASGRGCARRATHDSAKSDCLHGQALLARQLTFALPLPCTALLFHSRCYIP